MKPIIYAAVAIAAFVSTANAATYTNVANGQALALDLGANSIAGSISVDCSTPFSSSTAGVIYTCDGTSSSLQVDIAAPEYSEITQIDLIISDYQGDARSIFTRVIGDPFRVFPRFDPLPANGTYSDIVPALTDTNAGRLSIGFLNDPSATPTFSSLTFRFDLTTRLVDEPFATVPLPASALLLLGGLAGLSCLRRKSS